VVVLAFAFVMVVSAPEYCETYYYVCYCVLTGCAVCETAEVMDC
jgi:hypothetical protein